MVDENLVRLGSSPFVQKSTHNSVSDLLDQRDEFAEIEVDVHEAASCSVAASGVGSQPRARRQLLEQAPSPYPIPALLNRWVDAKFACLILPAF